MPRPGALGARSHGFGALRHRSAERELGGERRNDACRKEAGDALRLP